MVLVTDLEGISEAAFMVVEAMVDVGDEHITTRYRRAVTIELLLQSSTTTEFAGF